MIYLGEQKDALKAYSKEAICWLGIKIKGRHNDKNKNGYWCGDIDCHICQNKRKSTAINNNFRKLFTEKIIIKLVESKPVKLLKIHKKLKKKYRTPSTEDDDRFKNQCKKLFVTSGYLGWFQKEDEKAKKEKWNYKLARLINNHTCTYCNREYTFVYKRKGKGLVPQFDHWFPKTHYPLLALSFYNLIPSCATCNTIKAEEKFSLDHHLHPYVDKDISNSYKFDYIFKEAHVPEIFLRNNLLSGNKGKATFEALNLPFIYQGHSDKELKDLYELRFKYSDNYLKNLLENTFDSNLRISEREKYRLIFGIELDAKDYHKRIMSKFKSDIIAKILTT